MSLFTKKQRACHGWDSSRVCVPALILSFCAVQRMDPQLENLLEVSYEALMYAGLIIGELPAERCGVYVGCCGSDVWSLHPAVPHCKQRSRAAALKSHGRD